MTVFLIAMMHGVPVFLSALVFGTKTAIWVAAAIMAFVAGFFGNPAYMFVDWIGVAIGVLLGMLASVESPPRAEPENSRPASKPEPAPQPKPIPITGSGYKRLPGPLGLIEDAYYARWQAKRLARRARIQAKSRARRAL